MAPIIRSGPIPIIWSEPLGSSLIWVSRSERIANVVSFFVWFSGAPMSIANVFLVGVIHHPAAHGDGLVSAVVVRLSGFLVRARIEEDAYVGLVSFGAGDGGVELMVPPLGFLT